MCPYFKFELPSHISFILSVRIENTLSVGSDAHTVNLQDLFPAQTISAAVEMTLGVYIFYFLNTIFSKQQLKKNLNEKNNNKKKANYDTHIFSKVYQLVYKSVAMKNNLKKNKISPPT